MTTNVEVGKRLGIHNTMASLMKTGRRRPSVAILDRISKEYGISLAELHAAHVAGPEAFGELIRFRIYGIEPPKKRRKKAS